MAAAAAEMNMSLPRVIYFDNDQRVIDNVVEKCPKIVIVKVNETTGVLDKLPFGHRGMKEFEDKIRAENTYYKFLKIVTNGERYDRLSGIEDEEIAALYGWMQMTEGVPNRVALFDWDRTISKIEGVLLPPEPYSFSEMLDWVATKKLSQSYMDRIATIGAPITIEDALEYMCGGPERLAKIKGMFAKLVENGVKIMILTNNGGCSFPAFKELALGLFPAGYADDPRICSILSEGQKGKALINTGLFSDVCGILGGKRKRTRKQKKTKRRRTMHSRRRR